MATQVRKVCDQCDRAIFTGSTDHLVQARGVIWLQLQEMQAGEDADPRDFCSWHCLTAFSGQRH